MRLAPGLLLLASCELLFDVEPPKDTTADAASDAAASDCPMTPAPLCGLAAPDEDGDGMRDDCDSCPQIDGSFVDTDQDGVGDLCDPEPLRPQTCRARRFAGFTVDDGRWESVDGWTFGIGDGNAAAAAESDLFLTLRSVERHGPGAMQTIISDQAVGDPTDSLAGMVIMASATGGYFCALHPGDATGTLVLGRVAGTSEQVAAESAPFAQTPGLVHRLRLSVVPDNDGVKVVCGSEGAAADTSVFTFDASLGFIDNRLPPPGGYGVLSRSTLDEFEYVDFVPL